MQRSKLNRKDLNSELVKMIKKNLQLFNSRGIAFLVEGLYKIGELKDEILESLKLKIIQNLDNFHHHYIYKIVKSISIFDRNLAKSLIDKLKSQIDKLSTD